MKKGVAPEGGPLVVLTSPTVSHRRRLARIGPSGPARLTLCRPPALHALLRFSTSIVRCREAMGRSFR